MFKDSDEKDFNKCYKFLKKMCAINGTKLNSIQNIIRKFALKKLNNRKIYGDTIINIMDKVYTNYKSYISLRIKGLNPGKLKYLKKDAKFILPLYARSFSLKKKGIRICLGPYIAKNYNEICNTNHNVKSQKKFTNIYVINKRNKSIEMDGAFMHVPLDVSKIGLLRNKKINLVEIVDVLGKYKMNITYEVSKANINTEDEIITSKNVISIDLCMTNLATIYDPEGDQKIIKGKKLISLNEHYNHLISEKQSELNRQKIKTSRKYRDLFIKRSNKINNYFNRIVRQLHNLYKEKKQIIIGYNTGWKTKANMGTDQNRKFYDIPYRKLLNKIRNKFGENKVIEIEEAYTSKCDSLGLETICKHENYTGKRIKRGLFRSVKGLINADVNGAINIYRKFMGNKKIIVNEITGVNIFNPLKMRI